MLLEGNYQDLAVVLECLVDTTGGVIRGIFRKNDVELAGSLFEHDALDKSYVVGDVDNVENVVDKLVAGMSPDDLDFCLAVLKPLQKLAQAIESNFAGFLGGLSDVHFQTVGGNNTCGNREDKASVDAAEDNRCIFDVCGKQGKDFAQFLKSNLFHVESVSFFK